MIWLDEIWRRVGMLAQWGKFARELEEEMRLHRELKEKELIADGVEAREARYAANRQFGNATYLRERGREAWGWKWLEDFVQDLRFGARMLQKNPGFTVVAVVTLALGIGANTAIFAVVNGVLLRSMPFPEPDRLFMVSFVSQRGPFKLPPGLSDRHYLEFRDQDRLFEHLASFAGTRVNLTGAGDAIQVPAAIVTTEFFATLRASPEIGRGFLAGEDQPGHDNVVVLSNKLWKERFDSDGQILGKTIKLDGIGQTVIGVMAAGFEFPNNTEVWMPLGIRIDPNNSFTRPVVGRLNAGASRQQAQAELETFARRLPVRAGNNDKDSTAQIIPLKELLVADIRGSLLVFAVAVGFVLLIACANVANLFLVRGAGRGQEMAARSTLGAGRWRLVRQLLAESLMVSFAGGATGMLLAFWGVPVLLALAPAGKMPRMETIRVDGWVFAFTFGVSLMTGLVFGLVPALQATRRDVSESLNQGGRGMTRRHERVRSALAVSEIALALILLTGAGLMLKSFLRLRAVNPGFEPANLMSMTVDLPDSTYHEAPQLRAFHTRILAELSRVPGVRAAAAVNWRPLSEFLTMGDFHVEGGQQLPPGYVVDKPCVTPGYFKAMGIRLLRGREFTEGDNGTAPGVVIVSQSVARSLWTAEDPLGKRISMEDDPKPGDWLTVVGVVDDVKQQGLGKRSDPAIYQPYLQVTRPFFLSHMTFLVRTGSNTQGVASAMRAVLREVDRDQPVESIATMDSLIATTTAEPRFQARLLGAFAMMALALATVGIYGVLAYSVAQRTREIGVRVALGAQSADVLRMLLRGALGLVCTGIVVGGAGALAVTRMLARFLFAVKPSDPATFAMVALTLACVALTASCIPAMRAMKVDPMVALRYE
jgi:putative ABC transport system permease protein